MNSDLTDAEKDKIKIAKRRFQYIMNDVKKSEKNFLTFLEAHFIALGSCSCIDNI